MLTVMLVLVFLIFILGCVAICYDFLFNDNLPR